MVVERVYSGLTIAPDFKLTRVDGSDARMAGAYGGWMIDNTLLLGAGGYWTVDESRDRDMRYGGAVVEWLQFANRPVGFSVRGLVGGGTTTLTEDIAVIQLRDRDMMMGSRYGSVIFPPPLNVSPRFRFREHFFVAEPQASVLVNFNRRIRLNVGAGYRLIGTREGFGKRLRGATGSIGLEIGVTSR